MKARDYGLWAAPMNVRVRGKELISCTEQPTTHSP
jgi:hypothetical protein